MKILRNLFASLLLLVSSVVLADDYAYLTVVQTGAQTNFSISNIKNITFDDSNMLLNLNDNTQQKLPLSELSKMFFSNTGETGIMSVGSQQSAFSLKDGVLHIKGAKGSNVTIYDMSGKAVRNVTVREDDTQVNLSGLTKGAYIVKVGAEAKKFMNK